jgi:hypothetical protein
MNRSRLLLLAALVMAAAPALAQRPDPPIAPPPSQTPLTEWLGGHGATEWVDGCVVGGAIRRGRFDPTKLTFATRYGLSEAQWVCFFGYTGSASGAHGDKVERAREAMTRLGIPYVWPLDAYDLSMLTGATDRLLAASPDPNPRPPVEPTPTPTPRPTPSPTPSPVEAPTPCPTCEVCRECPPPAVYERARVPVDVVTRLHATLAALDRLASLRAPLIKWGEGRRALVRDSRTAIAEVESMLDAWVAGLYVPTEPSTGPPAVTTTVEEP